MTTKNYFQHELPNEAMMYIFKYIKNPISLIISCKRWSFICKDSQVKAEWIIFQFGKAHCLFYAIKLGPTFISVEVARSIIAKGGILSRYFAQRLLIHYGYYDQRLIELRITHSEEQIDIDSIRTLQQKTIPWASNLPITVYLFLLMEASNLFNDDLHLKGNDMELFLLYSGSFLPINNARAVLEKNYDEIKNLILCKKFVPFPSPSRKSNDTYVDLSNQHLLKNEYETNRHLTVIARSIVFRKDLVDLWKKIGYHEIYEDINDLVMKAALLILFPPRQPRGWIIPDVKTVKTQLIELIDLGFQLNYNTIIDIFHLFELRLDNFGKILIDTFTEIKQESQDCFLHKCLRETINTVSKSRSPNVSKFFYKYLPDTVENEFKNTFNLYADRNF